jgi:zinc protease
MKPSLVLALAIVSLSAASSASSQTTSVFATRVYDTTFANGMRAIIARTPPVPARPPRAFIGLYLRYGVFAAGRPELAHLVEHVTANNQPETVNYTMPPNVTAYGSNAMTRADFMSFWRTVGPALVPIMIPNRANRVAGVRDDSAIFVREVGRVAAETERKIARITANGPLASDVLPNAFVGPRIVPTALLDTIRSFDRATVFEQIVRYVRPDNAVLVIAGDVEIDATLAEVIKHMPTYAARGPRPSVRGPPFVRYQGPVVVRDDRITGARVGIGFEAPSRSAKAFLAYLILDQFLMGGRQPDSDSAEVARSLDSPLGRRLVAALGATALSDGVSYETDPPPLAIASPSYFAAYFDIPRAMPSDSIAAVTRRAVTSALTRDLTNAAIADAKRRLIAFYERWFLSPTLLPLADHLAAFALIDNQPSRLNRLASEINAVSPDRVRRLARWYQERGHVRLAIVLARENDP